MNNDPYDPDSPNYDPYEIGEETEYEENAFNTFNADALVNRRDRQNTEPIPQPRRQRPSSPPFPQNPNAQPPQYADPNAQPGIPAGDFSNFNPDAYLQQRYENRGGLVDPNKAAPLEGFEAPLPNADAQSGRSQARLARSRMLRSNYDIMRDGEPLIQVGVLLFFGIVGLLLSVCWLSNITLLFWYARR